MCTAVVGSILDLVGVRHDTYDAAVVVEITGWLARYHQSRLISMVSGVVTTTISHEKGLVLLSRSALLENYTAIFSGAKSTLLQLEICVSYSQVKVL